MMYNEDLAKIPIECLLGKNGIVAVWCTNAPSHYNSILNEMFPAWGITYVGTWYWVKVSYKLSMDVEDCDLFGKIMINIFFIGCKNLFPSFITEYYF